MIKPIKTKLEKALFAHQNGQLNEAEKLYREYTENTPNDSNGWYLLGSFCYQKGNLANAKEYLDYSIELTPKHPQALNSRGILYKETGQFEKAENDFRVALSIAPIFPEILTNLADTCRLIGKYNEAKNLSSRAIELSPELALAHNNHGAIEKALGNLNRAKISFEKALSLDSNFIDAAINLTITLKELEQTDEALKVALLTVKKAPKYGRAQNSLGLIYFDLKKDPDALDAFRLACNIDPNYAEAHNNLANTLTRLDQLNEANRYYDKALKLEPDNATFWSNKAATFQANNEIKEAITACNTALNFNPNHADARWNRGLANLIAGNLLDGFSDYEARWLLPEFKKRSFQSKLWENQNLVGKSILVFCEQGYGDAIQFVRYLALLGKKKPKALYFETRRPLIKLFKNIPEINQIFYQGENLPKTDYHIPLMSLAHNFKTTIENIPEIPPYLKLMKPSPNLFHYRELRNKKKKIGLVWKGRESHKNDKNRSIAIDLCLPFLKNPKTTFYSLQIGGSNECKKHSAYIKDLSTYITDFASTGSIIKNFDLIITVDTALAHLAGSLGVKCWVMLPYAPDWRWLLNKDDSPWYTSIKLFRQQKRNSWENVIKTVTRSIDKL